MITNFALRCNTLLSAALYLLSNTKKTLERVLFGTQFGSVFFMLQVIFDLTHELLRAEYQVTAHSNTFPWLKENLRSCWSRCHCRSTDVDEVKVNSGSVNCRIMRVKGSGIAVTQWQSLEGYGSAAEISLNTDCTN